MALRATAKMLLRVHLVQYPVLRPQFLGQLNAVLLCHDLLSIPHDMCDRNYFQGGGQAETQVDLLSTAYGFLKERGTDGYWVVRNGYPLPRLPGL
eukprot:1057202-Amphidinium_carterae.1